MDDFLIRPFESGDEVVINAAFNQVFGHSRDLSEWYWKFKNLNQSRILLAFDSSSKLVSHFAAVEDNFTFFGKIYKAGHTVDIFSSRSPVAVQNRIFQKTAKKFFREYGNPEHLAFVYGFPGDRSRKLGVLKLDYGTPYPVKYWEKKVKLGKRSYLGMFDNHVTLSKRAIDRLWRSASFRYPVSLVRDSSYINKRYLSKPNHNYRFLKSGFWGGYSCLCVYTIQDDVLFVIDLIWDGKRRQDLQRIEGILEQTARRNQISTLSMWLSGDPVAEEIFQNLNWQNQSEPQNLHLNVISFHQEIDREILLNKFYLTKGCTDII